jgi:hypothetical protein
LSAGRDFALHTAPGGGFIFAGLGLESFSALDVDSDFALGTKANQFFLHLCIP